MSQSKFNIAVAIVAMITFSPFACELQAQSTSHGSRMEQKNMVKHDMKKTVAKSNQAIKPFAFIELFTSEGCSSCPSADRNLERIAKQAKANGENVYTLSYHVDYWNYLGWKDPYSSKSFSTRQRLYAQQFDSDRVYTPQMVVNGKVEFVGSNQKVSERAVDLALKIKPESNIKLNAVRSRSKVKVDWDAEVMKNDGFLVLNVALVQNEGKQKVSRGENARRNLSHVNIVRELKSVERGAGSGQVEFKLPSGFSNDDYHVVGFLQSKEGVVAATKSVIADGKMMK